MSVISYTPSFGMQKVSESFIKNGEQFLGKNNKN
jgi:hypothetical protein